MGTMSINKKGWGQMEDKASSRREDRVT